MPALMTLWYYDNNPATPIGDDNYASPPARCFPLQLNRVYLLHLYFYYIFIFKYYFHKIITSA
jgi:hypothetical protein